MVLCIRACYTMGLVYRRELVCTLRLVCKKLVYKMVQVTDQLDTLVSVCMTELVLLVGVCMVLLVSGQVLVQELVS